MCQEFNKNVEISIPPFTNTGLKFIRLWMDEVMLTLKKSGTSASIFFINSFVWSELSSSRIPLNMPRNVWSGIKLIILGTGSHFVFTVTSSGHVSASILKRSWSNIGFDGSFLSEHAWILPNARAIYEKSIKIQYSPVISPVLLVPQCSSHETASFLSWRCTRNRSDLCRFSPVHPLLYLPWDNEPQYQQEFHSTFWESIDLRSQRSNRKWRPRCCESAKYGNFLNPGYF